MAAWLVNSSADCLRRRKEAMTVARDASRAAVAFAGVNPILRVMKISTQPLTMGGYKCLGGKPGRSERVMRRSSKQRASSGGII